MGSSSSKALYLEYIKSVQTKHNAFAVPSIQLKSSVFVCVVFQNKTHKIVVKRKSHPHPQERKNNIVSSYCTDLFVPRRRKRRDSKVIQGDHNFKKEVQSLISISIVFDSSQRCVCERQRKRKRVHYFSITIYA